MGSCPIIHIKDGQLRGFVSKADDAEAKPVFNYLGIPFGKSTDGKRRFLPPEKSEPWQGIRDATKVQGIPPQIIRELSDEYTPRKQLQGVDFTKQSEDCLHLNVFTPTKEETSQLPVMVWIVGGGFMRQAACSFDGAALSGMNSVVAVCPNYRANALGFLSLGRESKCPGNCALRDIILALKWVQENIHCFGGDPNNVTLFGESAGACLCHILTMSPLTKGLFHKVIASSGSSLSPMFFAEDLSPICNHFLSSLGIQEKDPDGILSKLQEMPIEKIVDVQKYDALFAFFPTVDGFVIENPPKVLAESGKIHSLPLLIGVADNETGGILSLESPPNFMEGSSLQDITLAMQYILNVTFGNSSSAERSKAIAEELLKKYKHLMKTKDDKYKYSEIYAKISGDIAFLIPIIFTATTHAASQNPLYLYLMTKCTEYSSSMVNGPDIRKKPPFVNCDHGDIIKFLWGDPFLKGDLPGGAWYTQDEKEMSRTVMRYFTNFAKNGNPNEGSPVPHEWPPYQLGSKRHLVLDVPARVDENLASEFQQYLMELFF